jgi:chromosome segregation ATPase
MEENKQELLPCPFCAASDPLLFRRDKTGISNLLAFVQCFNIDCGGSMNGHFTDESAIKAWNTRTSDVQSLQKVNASLQKYIEAQEKHVGRIQQQNAEQAARIKEQNFKITKLLNAIFRLKDSNTLKRTRIAELENQLKEAQGYSLEHMKMAFNQGVDSTQPEVNNPPQYFDTLIDRLNSERGTY